MEKIKSKHEQILETLSPEKRAESINLMMTIIENVEKALEEYRFERQRRDQEIPDDMSKVILTA